MLRLLRLSLLLIPLSLSYGFVSLRYDYPYINSGQGEYGESFLINPALNPGSTEILFTAQFLFMGSYINSLTFQSSIAGVNLGLSFFYFNSGDIEYIPEEVPQDEPTGVYRMEDFVLKLNLSRRWRNVSLGITPMWYRKMMLDYSGYGYGVDFGFHTYLSGGLSMGFSLKNWGQGVVLISQGNEDISRSISPPIIAGIGLSYEFIKEVKSLKLNLDFLYEPDSRVPYLIPAVKFGYRFFGIYLSWRLLDRYMDRLYLVNFTQGPDLSLSFRLMRMEIFYSFSYTFSGFSPLHKITVRFVLR